MKKIYKALIIGLAVLAFVGCNASDLSTNESTPVASEETSDQTLEKDQEKTQLTLDTITDEQLAELTGFETDFEAYMESEPSRVVFLKDVDGNFEGVSNMLIYRGSEEDSTSLYIQEENGIVVSAKLDEFNGSINVEGQNCDFVFYNFGNMLDKQPKEADVSYLADERESFEKNLKDEFIDSPLYSLHEKLGVYVPVYRYEMVGTDFKLNTYTIVSEVGYTASTDVNVIYDGEGNIKSLYMDDSYGPGKEDPLSVLSQFK